MRASPLSRPSSSRTENTKVAHPVLSEVTVLAVVAAVEVAGAVITFATLSTITRTLTVARTERKMMELQILSLRCRLEAVVVAIGEAAAIDQLSIMRDLIKKSASTSLKATSNVRHQPSSRDQLSLCVFRTILPMITARLASRLEVCHSKLRLERFVTSSPTLGLLSATSFSTDRTGN